MPLAKRDGRVLKDIAISSKHFVVTDVEKTIKTQYSSDTVAMFQETYPTEKFIWIMGSDNAAQVEEWKNWQRIYNKNPFSNLPQGNYTPFSDVEKKLKKIC